MVCRGGPEHKVYLAKASKYAHLMCVLQVAATIGSYSSAGALKHCVVLMFCIH